MLANTGLVSWFHNFFSSNYSVCSVYRTVLQSYMHTKPKSCKDAPSNWSQEATWEVCTLQGLLKSSRSYKKAIHLPSKEPNQSKSFKGVFQNTWGFNLVPWVMPPVMAQQCKFYQSLRGLQSTNVPYLSKDLGFVFTSASPMCKTFPSVKRMNTSIFPQIYILEVTWEITLLSYSMNFSLKTFHAAVTKDSWRLLLNWAMNSLVSFLKTLKQKKSKAFCLLLNKILPLLTVTNSTTNSPVSDQNKYELSSLMPHFSSPLPFCMFHRAALWASTTNVLY